MSREEVWSLGVCLSIYNVLSFVASAQLRHLSHGYFPLLFYLVVYFINAERDSHFVLTVLP